MSSYYPQEPNPFDRNFGYKGLKQNKSMSERYDDYNPNDRYDPDSWPPLKPLPNKRREPSEWGLGERASQLSLTFGVLSLINILVLGSWFFGIPTIILSFLGLHKAKEADSYGVVSLTGRILSWIAIAILALGYVLIVWAWFNAK